MRRFDYKSSDFKSKSKRALSYNFTYSIVFLIFSSFLLYVSIVAGYRRVELYVSFGISISVVTGLYSPLKWYMIATNEYIELTDQELVWRNWLGYKKRITRTTTPAFIKDWTSGWSFSPSRYLVRFPTGSITFYSNIESVDDLTTQLKVPAPSAKDRLWRGQYAKWD